MSADVLADDKPQQVVLCLTHQHEQVSRSRADHPDLHPVRAAPSRVGRRAGRRVRTRGPKTRVARRDGVPVSLRPGLAESAASVWPHGMAQGPGAPAALDPV